MFVRMLYCTSHLTGSYHITRCGLSVDSTDMVDFMINPYSFTKHFLMLIYV